MRYFFLIVIFIMVGVAGVVGFEITTGKGTASEIQLDGDQSPIAEISAGEEVDINMHLAPRVTTIIEFYADW
ncbi:MAG: hypothetical protein ACE5F1_22560 [Planctomycetota bacterium]